jgi:hypothetical protein
MRRAILVFSVVAVLHFALSIVGFLLVLPTAFEPTAFRSLLVWIASVLLAPVVWIFGSNFEIPHIAAVSAVFGAAAVLLMRLWAGARRRCAARPS